MHNDKSTQQNSIPVAHSRATHTERKSGLAQPPAALQLRLNCTVCRLDEPDDAIIEYTGDILTCTKHAMRKVGRVRVRTVNLDESQDTAFDVLGCTDGATDEYLALFSEDGDFSKAVQRLLRPTGQSSQNLLLIDRVEILPKARGCGLGQRVIRLIEATLGTNCRLAVLKPFPLQHESKFNERRDAWSKRMGYEGLASDYERGLRKIEKLYQRCGFRSVPRTPFMVHGLFDREE